MKKIDTRITVANEGMHNLEGWKSAKAMLEKHNYVASRLYHIVLTGSNNVKPYKAAIKALCRTLREKDMPCQYRACLEYDGEKNKGLHFHIFLLVEASNANPDNFLSHKASSWLTIYAAQNGIKHQVCKPMSPIHNTKSDDRPLYASIPKSKPEKLEDCKVWISYLYKARSKDHDIQPIYYSSRNK